MNVLIAGGSGFIGRRLQKRLHKLGHEVTWVTRNPHSHPEGQRTVSWDEEDLRVAMEQHQAIVNLAGVNLFDRRWNLEFKKNIKNSRVQSVQKLVKAIKNANKKPEVYVQGSAIGYYGSHNSTEDYDENTPVGYDYLANTCLHWEQATQELESLVERLVIVRIGVVLGRGGGAVESMAKSFKLYMGGVLGSGEQWVSWIHIDDITALLVEAIFNNSYQGVFNGTAPNPVTHREQCRSLAKAMKRPCWLPVPRSVIRLALGEVSDIVLNGQRVLPVRALDSGFVFEYPIIDLAFEELFA